MIKSMTGYGKGEYINDNRKYTVEIRSVNHKYSDINIRIPRMLSLCEENVRKQVANNISRGKIEVNIAFDNFSELGKNIRIDDELFEKYLTEFARVAEKYKIENDLKMSNMIAIENLIGFEHSSEDNEVIMQELEKAVQLAINSFNEMKSIEGNKIAQNLFEKINILSTNIDEIEKLSFSVVDEYKEKIENRLQEYIEKSDIDNNRILTEIIIFADKMTIDEEIIRFKSHISQLTKTLNSEEAVGKKLDFLIQEMNRETNTIGSKTNKLDITNIVIQNKAILENIREQIQNIE